MTPTTKDDFNKRRTVPVTLADGTLILCRLASVRDLFLKRALPTELVSTVAAIQDRVSRQDMTTEEMADALRTTREGADQQRAARRHVDRDLGRSARDGGELLDLFN